MQIDPAVLAAIIGELHDLDLERGLTATLQQVVMAATALFGADGAGLMLADANGELRWASASDQQPQLVEEEQNGWGWGRAGRRSPSGWPSRSGTRAPSPIPMVPVWSFALLGSRPG
jgi:hypothetical protein